MNIKLIKIVRNVFWMIQRFKVFRIIKIFFQVIIILMKIIKFKFPKQQEIIIFCLKIIKSFLKNLRKIEMFFINFYNYKKL